MNNSIFDSSESLAKDMDARDPLAHCRDQFHIPLASNGRHSIYLAGNSLGLQPRKSKEYIEQELEDWAKFGVEGHFQAKNPWFSYHSLLTEQTARLVGALPIEVVVMNTLSVNLHLMMVSFYRPTTTRYKILIEGGAFPSDQYAVASQAAFHGLDIRNAIVELTPRANEALLRTEDILRTIKKEGSSIALVLLGNVNYLTGQAFDIQAITKYAHSEGCFVGFDLAHGVGNLDLHLHDWGPDFAVWCGYKYLNGGPGALAGCFVHERHAKAEDIPRFAGWWGNDKSTRFQMNSKFSPSHGAEGWQLSNPPIFQMASLRASLELFDNATMSAVRTKSKRLTGYLEYLISYTLPKVCQIITPSNSDERGCQLSLKFNGNAQNIVKKLSTQGVICDFREPNIIRISPTPLYNTYSDVYNFVKILSENLSSP